jgi:CNT family concentrative nucleoside transporter
MVLLEMSARSKAVLTYALCGFANFSCIGIQIGGIGSLVPEKKSVLSELGMRALLGATIVNFMSALMANILL